MSLNIVNSSEILHTKDDVKKHITFTHSFELSDGQKISTTLTYESKDVPDIEVFKLTLLPAIKKTVQIAVSYGLGSKVDSVTFEKNKLTRFKDKNKVQFKDGSNGKLEEKSFENLDSLLETKKQKLNAQDANTDKKLRFDLVNVLEKYTLPVKPSIKPSITTPPVSLPKSVRELEYFIDIDKKIKAETVVNQTKLINDAWARIEKLNASLKKEQKLSYLEKNRKKDVVELLKKGNCLGIAKVFEKLINEKPGVSNEDIITFFSDYKTLEEIVFNQMLHIVIDKSTLSTEMSKKFASYNSPINLKDTVFQAKSTQDIASIQSVLNRFTKNLNPKNKKGFSLYFGETNAKASHIIYVQKSERGFRLYDQSLGVTRWLSEAELAEFIAAIFVRTPKYTKCYLN